MLERLAAPPFFFLWVAGSALAARSLPLLWPAPSAVDLRPTASRLADGANRLAARSARPSHPLHGPLLQRETSATSVR